MLKIDKPSGIEFTQPTFVSDVKEGTIFSGTLRYNGSGISYSGFFLKCKFNVVLLDTFAVFGTGTGNSATNGIVDDYREYPNSTLTIQ